MKKEHGTLIIPANDIGKDTLIMNIILKLQSIKSGSLKVEVNIQIRREEITFRAMKTTDLDLAIFAVWQEQKEIAKKIIKELTDPSKTENCRKKIDELNDEYVLTKQRQETANSILGENIMSRLTTDDFRGCNRHDIKSSHEIVLIPEDKNDSSDQAGLIIINLVPNKTFCGMRG